MELPVINQPPSAAPARTPSAAMTLPARLTWKDANGAVRFTSVRTREVTETGAVVECDAAVALPLYRLVHLQVEKAAREWVELPQPLSDGRVPVGGLAGGAVPARHRHSRRVRAALHDRTGAGVRDRRERRAS